MIASIYGRNNLDEYLEKCAENGLVLAINTEKVDELRLSIGGHFSEATAPINFDCTIAYSIKSVKHMDVVEFVSYMDVVEFVSDQPDFHEDAAYMQLG